MAIGQWRLVNSGQAIDVNIPSGNYLWPTIRVMNPNDGVLYVRQNGPITDTGYGGWDYKCPAQSFGILPSEGAGWQSAGLYYIDQSGTNRPGEVAMYLSMQTVAEPTFVAVGRSLVTQSSSVDIASGNQPANPGAGYGRLWIDTNGHLNVLQPSGTNFLVIDSNNIGAQSIGGDLFGTIGAAHINVLYGNTINMQDSGNNLRTFAGVSGGGTYIYQVGTGALTIQNQAKTTNLLVLDQSGNATFAGIVLAPTLEASGNVQLQAAGSLYWPTYNYQIYPNSGLQCNTNFWISGSSTVAGTLVVGTGSVSQNGDISCGRSGGTTAVLYLGSSGTRYLYYDGTNYNMPGGTLQVASLYTSPGGVTTAAIVCTGNITQVGTYTGAQLELSSWGWMPTIYLNNANVAPYIQNAGTLGGNNGPIRYAAGFHSMESYAGGYAAVNGASFNVGSARRFKSDIAPIEDPISIILEPTLHGISYTDISKEEPQPRIGFVADDWQPIVPEVVFMLDNQVEAMAYADVTAILFEALKEYITKTDARLAKLEGPLAAPTNAA
jgi:hypothetical protein